MRTQWKIMFFTMLIILIYSLLFYLQISFQMRMDFYSFYAAAIAYSKNLNPFQELVSTFASIHNKLPANLNPPAFIVLISPIIHLNVTAAASLWFALSLIFGIAGSLICFYLLSPKHYFTQRWFAFVLIYLATYANLINTACGQIGHFLLFFIMAGYYCFLKRKEYWAGILWGFIITIKLFPGLLFLFALLHKRYKVFFTMLGCCLALGLLSLQAQGISIYSLYFKALSQITLYGSNWNGSIYGFLFRLLSPKQEMLTHIIYYLSFTALLLWYICKIHYLKQKKETHTAFGFTLIMMLLLSPLGWVYYFTLLIMPLTFIWFSMNKQGASMQNSLLWVLCLFLLNFPAEFTQERYMGLWIYKLSFYSIYLYGLIISLYLLLNLPSSNSNETTRTIVIRKEPLLAVQCALGFGLLIIISNLIYALNG